MKQVYLILDFAVKNITVMPAKAGMTFLTGCRLSEIFKFSQSCQRLINIFFDSAYYFNNNWTIYTFSF
jgi:hypothetical protein